MRATDFEIQEFIESLQGTCSTISEKLASDYEGMEEEDLTDEEVEHLDSEIFRCEDCSWWCEMSEMSEKEQICRDCEEG